MPHDAEGRPLEVLLNPLGVISRGNPAQIIEAALGKIVEKTGQPYKLTDFDSAKDLRTFAEQELRKHGISDTEDLIDPESGKTLPGVMTGNRFIMKLHHTAEAKAQGRATGAYTAEGVPAKGGEEGSKRLGMLDLNALLSHGAFKTVRDASVVRGQRNEDYWRQVMSGYTPPEPRVPFVYEKFINNLKASGINAVKRGTKMNIMALSNDDVTNLTGDRRLTNAETVDWRIGRLTPIKGGLFDEAATGGHGGNRWSYIQLDEPVPNPVMEEPIRYLLGMTKKKFEDVLAGREMVGDTGKTGAEGLKEALSTINVDQEIVKERDTIKTGRKTARDDAIRRLNYLQGCKDNGQQPAEWILDRVPVLPPTFRTVSLLANTGKPLVADPNYLYKEVFDANEQLQQMKKHVEDVSEERLTVYKAFKGVTGLGDPVHPKHVEQGVKGILKQIFGSSPKFGTVQRKLLGSTVDLVGRASITPNPNMDMDHVGIPINKAWTLYRPFIVRRLVRQGMSRIQALRDFTDKQPVALKALTDEMDERPVVINRAPVLHRYGIMSFWPKLTQSDTLEVSPLITGGFGADFDGDAMQFHLPADPGAVEEAKTKLLPSHNLFAAGSFNVHYTPTREYVGGLWQASTMHDKGKATRLFRTKADALEAYRRGDVGVGQHVEIVQH